MRKQSIGFKFTVDSNYLIAYLQTWHSHHEATVKDFGRRLARAEQFHLIPHTLTETYAVMTRMPEPYRVAPSLAFDLMSDSFRKYPILEHPPASDCWDYLSGMAGASVGGGRSYDVWIARTAHFGGLHALVTWNAKHFERNPYHGLAILTPVT